MSEKSIKLSPKYGVNPTIPTCFFCGEDKNEIAMLGKMGKGKEDVQAPMHMVLDYTPCDKCREQFSRGFLLVETTENPSDNRPPISDTHYPTGKYVVLKSESANRIFERDDIKDGDRALIDEQVFNRMFPPEAFANRVSFV